MIEFQKAEFLWDGEMQGYILSAIYYGGLLMQFLSGWLASSFGGYIIIIISVGIASILTICTPYITTTCGLPGIITTRVIIGMALVGNKS